MVCPQLHNKRITEKKNNPRKKRKSTLVCNKGRKGFMFEISMTFTTVIHGEIQNY